MNQRFERKNATVTTVTKNNNGLEARESKTFFDENLVPSINQAKKFMREQVQGGVTTHLSVVR